MQLTKINGQYDLWLPEHRASRPEWKLENGGWEAARIDTMLERISLFKHRKQRQPIVFDVGTEEGDISALIAKYTKAPMVLFEPNHRVWSCIRAIWTANYLEDPLDFFSGFLGSEGKAGPMTEWGSIKWSESELMPDHGFKALHEQYPDVPVARLDDWCKGTGIYPDVITMDVEGSEFEVIRGAEKTLREKRPVIFMSVHPEFMYESYRNEGIWKERYGERQHVVHMLRFIDELGYTHRCIEYDYHELHMVFEPK